MARESSTYEQNVASFEYNAATILQPFLFELNRPIDDLTEMLREKFAGRVMTMIEVYKAHHVDTPYVKGNYKTALNILEASKLIHVDPPADERPKRKGETTFKDNAIVTFPPKEVV